MIPKFCCGVANLVHIIRFYQAFNPALHACHYPRINVGCFKFFDLVLRWAKVNLHSRVFNSAPTRLWCGIQWNWLLLEQRDKGGWPYAWLADRRKCSNDNNPGNLATSSNVRNIISWTYSSWREVLMGVSMWWYLELLRYESGCRLIVKY